MSRQSAARWLRALSSRYWYRLNSAVISSTPSGSPTRHARDYTQSSTVFRKRYTRPSKANASQSLMTSSAPVRLSAVLSLIYNPSALTSLLSGRYSCSAIPSLTLQKNISARSNFSNKCRTTYGYHRNVLCVLQDSRARSWAFPKSLAEISKSSQADLQGTGEDRARTEEHPPVERGAKLAPTKCDTKR
jgi:hypothetical protein